MTAPRCAVRRVDLDAPIPSLALPPGYDALLVVFWWHDRPCGRRLLRAGELPLPPAVVADLAARAVGSALLDRIGVDVAERAGPTLARCLDPGAVLASSDPPRADGARLSVIVCTRDRPRDLERCLAALVPSLPAGAEAIVVDNAPDLPATRRVVERLPDVRWIAEPRPGLSVARNTGIAAARGELVAFTDDDVVVHDRWAARLLAAFDEPEVACVTGLVLPAELDSEAQSVFELDLGGFGQGFVPRRFGPDWFRSWRLDCPPVWTLGAGANMAMRRNAIARVGAFDERLGAGAAGCSEDSELWYRLLAAGLECRYAPDAVVFHHHRGDWASLRRQTQHYMRGHVAALLVQFAGDRDPRNLFRLGVRLPIHYLREGARLLLGRLPAGRRRLLPAQLAGCLAGLTALAGRRPRATATAGQR